MDCRKFRNNHVAYVDDLLPAFEMDAMQRHLMVCPACAHHDTKIRRGLILIRNLPSIEASPDFMERLNARLAELPAEVRQDHVGARSYLSSVGTFAALAAGLAAVAYMAMETNRYFAPPGDVVAVPTVAAASMSSGMPSAMPGDMPGDMPAPISNAALVASVPTGIPVWPTVLMVGQAPLRFASTELSDADPGR